MARTRSPSTTTSRETSATKQKTRKKNYRPKKWGPEPVYEPKPASELREIEGRFAAFASILRRPAPDGSLRPFTPEELTALFEPTALSRMIEKDTPEETRRARSRGPSNRPAEFRDPLFHQLRPIVGQDELGDGAQAALEFLSLLYTLFTEEDARGAPLLHELVFLRDVVRAAERFQKCRDRLRRDARRLAALEALGAIYDSLARSWPKKKRMTSTDSDIRFSEARVKTSAQRRAIEQQRAELVAFVATHIPPDAQPHASQGLVIDGDYVHAINGPRRAAAIRLEEYLDVSATKLEKLRQQTHLHAQRAKGYAEFVPRELVDCANDRSAPLGLLINHASQCAARFTSLLVLGADPRLQPAQPKRPSDATSDADPEV
jgi:hypothetical protein